MGNISEYKPGDDITHSWQAASGLPWDPFDSCAVHTQREVVCPKCEVIVIARSSPHILDLVVLFSAVLVHSLPCSRKGRSGTRGLQMCL